jgi:hypothetical protein
MRTPLEWGAKLKKQEPGRVDLDLQPNQSESPFCTLLKKAGLQKLN